MGNLTKRFLDWAEKNPRGASLLLYFVLGVVSGVVWALFGKPTDLCAEQDSLAHALTCGLLNIANSAVFGVLFVTALVLAGIAVATQLRGEKHIAFLYALLVLSTVAFLSAPTWFHLVDDRWEYRPGQGAYCLVPKGQMP
jgi:di/tricarboxylate transporter